MQIEDGVMDDAVASVSLIRDAAERGNAEELFSGKIGGFL